MTELVREDSLTIGWQWDWAFASSARFGWWQHRPPLLNYSLGNAIIRHKGLSFASALWKPGDINCRDSLPSPVLPPPVGVLAPAAHIQHLNPLSALRSSRESLFHEPELRIFPVLRIPLSYGSVCVGGRAPLDFAPMSPMQTRRTSDCFQTLLRAANTTPKESKMFVGTGDVF